MRAVRSTDTATLASDKGSVAYPDNAHQPLVAYTGLALDAHLSPQSMHATLHAVLDHDGKIDGDVALNGAPARRNRFRATSMRR